MIRSNDHHHHNESGKHHHHHHPSKSTKAERRKQNAAAQQEQQLNYNSQADSRANGAGNSANFTQDFNFKKKLKHRNQDDQFDPQIAAGRSSQTYMAQ